MSLISGTSEIAAWRGTTPILVDGGGPPPIGDPGPGPLAIPGSPVTITPQVDYTPPSGYVRVAMENETAAVSGDVAYGANGVFTFKNLSGPVTFDNATFGDPLFGTVKAGYAKPTAVNIKPVTAAPVNNINPLALPQISQTAQQLAKLLPANNPTMSLLPTSGPFSGYTPPSPVGGGVPNPPVGGFTLDSVLQQLANAGISAGLGYITNKITGTSASPGGPPTLAPPTGGVMGGSGTGGVGGINLPTAPGSAGGVVYQPGKGYVLRTTTNATRTVDRRVRMTDHGWALASRRMNVLNPHALRRAFHRVQGFRHVAAEGLKFFGYHVSGHPKAKGHGKAHFGGGHKRKHK